MIQRTTAFVRRWLDKLLHVDDTPQRTAAAFALGVFFGFSPLFGLHTVLAVGLAFLLNLNRVATVLGVYSNLPWVIAPYYALATLIGARLVGQRIPRGFRGQLRHLFDLSVYDGAFWHTAGEVLRPMLWPYVIGTTFCAALLAAGAYQLALGFILSRRRIAGMMHKP